MTKSINVLGTEYTIEVLPYDADPAFRKSNIDGYCEQGTHRIVIGDLHTFPGWEDESDEFIEAAMKHTLIHEAIHGFFNESGLQDSSATYDGPFAKNEMLVDWIAIQIKKIYKALEEADAL